MEQNEKINFLNVAIGNAKQAFYDEITKMPEGVVNFGEDLLHASGKLYASIIFDGIVSFRRDLEIAGYTPSEISEKVHELLDNSVKMYQDALKEIVLDDITRMVDNQDQKPAGGESS